MQPPDIFQGRGYRVCRPVGRIGKGSLPGEGQTSPESNSTTKGSRDRVGHLSQASALLGFPQTDQTSHTVGFLQYDRLARL